MDALGRGRVLWASDATRRRVHHTWAAARTYILASDRRSAGDKEWILGRSERILPRWPASEDLSDRAPWATRA
jgi:hypothetical protein